MGRHQFDGATLAEVAARLQEQDRIAPPQARASLMGVVRAFDDFIETRAKLGWSAAMIAVLLTEAGYPIDAATLRSYRKRLRDGRADGPSSGKIDSFAKATAADGAANLGMPSRPDSKQIPAAEAPSETDRPPAANGTARADQPAPQLESLPRHDSGAPAPAGRSFTINRANLPPDRA